MTLIQLFFYSVAFASVPGKKTVIVGHEKPSIAAQRINESHYPSLAKIDMQKAIQRARAVSPGRLIESSLEAKNDFLVYRVAFTEDPNRHVVVFIDAGTGAFLRKETLQH